jgi:hypothetical protein
MEAISLESDIAIRLAARRVRCKKQKRRYRPRRCDEKCRSHEGPSRNAPVFESHILDAET